MKVQREDIVDYATYGENRKVFKEKVLREKEPRRVHLGQNLTFLFENAVTIQYQIQEMMLIEKIVKDSDIRREIETYNELLGNAGELGCTLLIEIENPEERNSKLREWVTLMDFLWMEVEDGSRVPPIFDSRQIGEDRLSSVQYLKFSVGKKKPVALLVAAPYLNCRVDLTSAQKMALSQDLAMH